MIRPFWSLQIAKKWQLSRGGLGSDRMPAGKPGNRKLYPIELKQYTVVVSRELPHWCPAGITLALMQGVPRQGVQTEFGSESSEETSMTKREKGFSLIELLIVVAIILIIAAIAIPNLIRSRMAANEASAVGSVRTINTAAITYNSSYGHGFPTALTQIGTTSGSALGCDNAELLDEVLTKGLKSGYTFAVLPGLSDMASGNPVGCTVVGSSDGYGVSAVPTTPGTSGQRGFCSDASGVIRFDATGAVAFTTPLCNTTMNPLQ